jgi:hypothetical protein
LNGEFIEYQTNEFTAGEVKYIYFNDVQYSYSETESAEFFVSIDIV